MFGSYSICFLFVVFLIDDINGDLDIVIFFFVVCIGDFMVDVEVIFTVIL